MPINMKAEIEAALTEVVDQITIGAKPLALKPTTAKRYKDLYRPDFEEQYQNPEDWPNAKVKILALSRLVGHLATFMTNADAVLKGKPAPTEVDETCAL